jgi:hypothetical protein
VCFFVPSSNPHFLTHLNQTLNTSPPWPGRDHGVCFDPKFLTFLSFFGFLTRDVFLCLFFKSAVDFGHVKPLGITVKKAVQNMVETDFFVVLP